MIQSVKNYNTNSRPPRATLSILRGALSHSGGFAALMIVIILSLILILVSTLLSQSGFFTRQILSESEFKERSLALAEACADNARLKLANLPTYVGDETLTITGTDTCDIKIIDPLANPIIIKTRAVYRESVTNLVVEVNPSNMNVLSWKEVASF